MTSASFFADDEEAAGSFKVQHVTARLKLYFYFTAFWGGVEVVLLDVCEDLRFKGCGFLF